MDHLKETAQRSSKYDEMEEMSNKVQSDNRCRCGVRAEGCDGWEAATAFRCNNRAKLVQGTVCRLGSRALNRRDSDLFSPGSAVRRLRNAVARTEAAEGKTIAALITELETERRTPDNHMSGDEHSSHIMEFYDMAASAGAGGSLAEITEAQQSDGFASQMSAFLTKEVLPSDEMEVMRTIANTPFW